MATTTLSPDVADKIDQAADALADWIMEAFDPGSVLTGTLIGRANRRFLAHLTSRLKDDSSPERKEWVERLTALAWCAYGQPFPEHLDSVSRTLLRDPDSFRLEPKRDP